MKPLRLFGKKKFADKKSKISPKILPNTYVPRFIFKQVQDHIKGMNIHFQAWILLVIVEELRNPRVLVNPTSIEPGSEKYLDEAKKIYSFVALNNKNNAVEVISKEFLASLRYEIGIPDLEKLMRGLMQLCKAGLYEEVLPNYPNLFPEGYKMLKITDESTNINYAKHDRHIERERKK